MGSYSTDKDATIGELIHWCDDLEALDTLCVYDYGKNGDLLLEIQKEPEYDDDKAHCNMVRIFTSQKREDGLVEEVDDTEDTCVTNGSLKNELERIWEYRDFGTV